MHVTNLTYYPAGIRSCASSCPNCFAEERIKFGLLMLRRATMLATTTGVIKMHPMLTASRPLSVTRSETIRLP